MSFFKSKDGCRIYYECRDFNMARPLVGAPVKKTDGK